MANSKLCSKYGFEKPNDKRALELMNAAARAVVTELPDITIAYGVSDEFSKLVSTGTLARDKNEILFSRFGINYNNEPEIYKKGSVVFRDYELVEPGSHNTETEVDRIAEPVVQSKTQAEKDKKKREKTRVLVDHLDIIKDDFWDRRPWLLVTDTLLTARDDNASSILDSIISRTRSSLHPDTPSFKPPTAWFESTMAGIVQTTLIWVAYAVAVALSLIAASITTFTWQTPRDRFTTVSVIAILSLTALLSTILLLPVDTALVSATTTSLGVKKDWATIEHVDKVLHTLKIVYYTLYSFDALLWEHLDLDYFKRLLAENNGEKALAFALGVLVTLGTLLYVVYTGAGLALLPVSIIKTAPSLSAPELSETNASALEINRERQRQLEMRHAGRSAEMPAKDRRELEGLLREERTLHCGYILGHINVFQPINWVFLKAARAFPADYILMALLALLFFSASVTGIAAVGIRFLWVRIFQIRKGRTAPQALLIATVMLALIALAINYAIVTMVAPQYSTYGTQTFCTNDIFDKHGRPDCSQHRDLIVPCSEYLKYPRAKDVCTPTVMSTFLNRITITWPFFGMVDFWAQFAFLGIFLIVFVTVLFRTPKLNMAELDEEAEADEEEGLLASTGRRFGATWQDITGRSGQTSHPARS
ncbi:unnamed protein product [Parascedosporium putredinis]|uniref:Thg1 C-terminal domain-containing protein n=1 Tax=Parascedosporium putredinis TaxID=1442378 RepID=A0A9P1H9U0_9PEZI|nr:unnamed protein product [Parascedosporium putredinis]CAI8002165.1 unnamed protein product [Parascedosporium putredinis]